MCLYKARNFVRGESTAKPMLTTIPFDVPFVVTKTNASLLSTIESDLRVLILTTNSMRSPYATKQNMKRSLVLIFILSSLAGVVAEANPPAAPSPAKVVTDLYNAHRGKADPLRNPESKKLLGAYFEKSLLSLYLKDQAQSQGEIGKLDFDPLYDAQDFDIKDFAVAVRKQQKDSAEVVASFKNLGTNTKIVFTLSNTAQGWRIADIKYSGGRTLRGILK
jgi:hypothetical protein